MRKTIILHTLLSILSFSSYSQVGLGVYPSGSEAGLSFKTSKLNSFFADIRMSDFNFSQNIEELSFKNEVFAKYRLTYFERINFIIGLGPRMEFYGQRRPFWGIAAPIAVEAFPFPFPNAALFFEVAPFYASDLHGQYHGGFRTASGINFYFVPRKSKLPENGQ
ncbi:MAG: hypothetical protein ACK4ND_05980 [Cytophagaceae bacterium]